jgi:hypothetical protein
MFWTFTRIPQVTELLSNVHEQTLSLISQIQYSRTYKFDDVKESVLRQKLFINEGQQPVAGSTPLERPVARSSGRHFNRSYGK